MDTDSRTAKESYTDRRCKVCQLKVKGFSDSLDNELMSILTSWKCTQDCSVCIWVGMKPSGNKEQGFMLR